MSRLFHLTLALVNSSNGFLLIDEFQTKATLYTWLAWQKKPGQALVSTINADFIELQSKEIQAFIRWLRSVFTETN